MKTPLLILCLLGCTHLLLVVGLPTRDTEGLLPGTLDHAVDLRRDADEQRKELSVFINDNTTDALTTEPSGLLSLSKVDEDTIVGAVAIIVIAIVIVCCVIVCIFCIKNCRRPDDRPPTPKPTSEPDVCPPPPSPLPNAAAGEGDDYDKCFRSFLEKHPEYRDRSRARMELGSRMQKRWYQVEMKDNRHEKKILTIAPVSHQCPLKLHKHQKGLNKLLGVVKEHPYLHSIELVEYLPNHELLVMVQPLIEEGSLKDMIYKATPLTNWSDKYARRSRGLHPKKIARYGRQILEAMKFLCSLGFPVLGHVQSGNIFIVDDVCHLGGYENTLLGYKTRLFRLCKDHIEHLDVILFGHLVFEMAAGYELTQLRPSEEEYKTVDKSMRPILEHIFAEEGFPHDVDEISSHEFFSDSLSELNDFDPNQQVQLSKSMNKVLEKVRKGKARVQRNKDGIETVVAKVKMTFHEIKQKFGHGGEDSKGDLEGKPPETQKRLKLKVDRGGEASAGNVKEKSPKNQKTLRSKYGAIGEDSEGTLKKKPAKTQKKSKGKSSEDIENDDTKPLLGDKG